jgi:1-acyl-sn-glycerol-3-phosphate acyltransferase
VRFALRVKGDPPLFAFARVLLTTGLRIYHRFAFCGVENVPSTGPAILVSNHHSDVDPILLGMPVPRTVHFISDETQFRRGFVGPVISRLGAVPINKGAPDRRGIERALELLRRGEVVAVFPEGDLFRQTEMEPFGRGVALLAVRSGAPIVPAAIVGAEKLYMNGRVAYPDITVVYGAPVRLGDLQARGHAAYRQIAERVRDEVVRLHDRGCV